MRHKIAARAARLKPHSSQATVSVREDILIPAAFEYHRPADVASCAGSADDVRRLADLFDRLWLNAGRVRPSVTPSTRSTGENSRAAAPGQSAGAGRSDQPDDDTGAGDSHADGTGKLAASDVTNLMRKDLRKLVSPEDIRTAETIAPHLGRAIRNRPYLTFVAGLMRADPDRLLRYTAKAELDGKFAQPGSRLIQGNAQKLAGNVFTAFAEQGSTSAEA